MEGMGPQSAGLLATLRRANDTCPAGHAAGMVEVRMLAARLRLESSYSKDQEIGSGPETKLESRKMMFSPDKMLHEAGRVPV